jgi:16S rRNA (guanine527-N7)-methyltransferase
MQHEFLTSGLPEAISKLPHLASLTQPIRSDLERFVDLLRSWHGTHNLVSRTSLNDVWTRHVVDSLQLLDSAPPDFQSWIDLGSGAGFPGLVVAIASKLDNSRHFWLIESNLKKAAFLRSAILATSAPASVAAVRIEDFAKSRREKADVVSARALANVTRVCSLAAPLLRADSVLLLPKGQDFSSDLQEASRSWLFDVVSTPSVTDSRGRVLAIRNLRPRVQP